MVEHNKKTLVVNLFGGPGTGKSHCAARLYGHCNNWDAELVREYAKDLVWEERTVEFEDQLTIIGKQLKRLNAVKGKVDVVFTDSPILLGAIYDKAGTLTETFKTAHDKYWNLNIFLRRTKAYNPNGRFQTEEEAKNLDTAIKAMLDKYDVTYIELDCDGTEDAQIMRYVNLWLEGIRRV